MGMTNVSFRIDEDIKQETDDVLTEMGMTMSGAINVFFRQILRLRAIPFEIKADPKRISDEEYFSNPHNIKHIHESVKQLETGDVVVKTFAELEAMEND